MWVEKKITRKTKWAREEKTQKSEEKQADEFEFNTQLRICTKWSDKNAKGIH